MNKEEEIYYYAFCIGYDLMNDYFKGSKNCECDLVFEQCKKLATEFINSKEYNDYSKSAYDKLKEWLINNKYYIRKGNKIKIVYYNNHCDEELLNWAESQNKNEFEIVDIDYENEVFWVEKCIYGIPFDSDDYILIKEE